MPTEKFARPGLYLDEDDHGRLIGENRAAYAREEADRISVRIDKIETALDVVANTDERRRLKDEMGELKRRRTHLGTIVEGHRR